MAAQRGELSVALSLAFILPYAFNVHFSFPRNILTSSIFFPYVLMVRDTFYLKSSDP